MKLILSKVDKIIQLYSVLSRFVNLYFWDIPHREKTNLSSQHFINFNYFTNLYLRNNTSKIWNGILIIQSTNEMQENTKVIVSNIPFTCLLQKKFNSYQRNFKLPSHVFLLKLRFIFYAWKLTLTANTTNHLGNNFLCGIKHFTFFFEKVSVKYGIRKDNERKWK